jgi:hypothetical protein
MRGGRDLGAGRGRLSSGLSDWEKRDRARGKWGTGLGGNMSLSLEERRGLAFGKKSSCSKPGICNLAAL